MLLGFLSPAYGLAALDRYAGDGDPSRVQWVLVALALVAAVATDRMLARRRRRSPS